MTRDQAGTAIAVAGVVGLGIGVGIGSGQTQGLGGLHAPFQFDALGGHFTRLGLLAGSGGDEGVGLLQIEQCQVDVAIEEAGGVLDARLVQLAFQRLVGVLGVRVYARQHFERLRIGEVRGEAVVGQVHQAAGEREVVVILLLVLAGGLADVMGLHIVETATGGQ